MPDQPRARAGRALANCRIVRGRGAGHSRVYRLGLVVACLALSGCVSRPLGELSQPKFDMPARFSLSGDAARPDRWWRAFDDPGLNQLIEHALRHNFSLRARYARVKRARAMVAAATADLFPTATGRLEQSVTRRPDTDSPDFGDSSRSFNGSGVANGADRGAEARDFSGFERDRWAASRSARLTASYEIDLWGRLRARREAEKLSVRARRAALRAAAMTTSADIASDWYKLQELNARLALLHTQQKVNENILKLTRYAFKNGQSAVADILRQREAVESVRGQIAQTRAQRNVRQHALAVLVGVTPQTFEPPDGKLVATPALPATGVPAALLMRRPDVRQDYFTLAADNRRVAAALADRYPELSLSATLSASSDVGSIFSDWLLQLAGSLTQTLFDGGAKAAKVAQARATVDEDVADYQQTMLTALKEVENALTRGRQQKAYLARLRRQLALSKKTVANLRLRYLRGAADYFNVLDAVLDRQNLQVNRLTGRYNLLMYRINLYRALAGGLDDVAIGRPPPKAAAARDKPNQRTERHAPG